MGRPSKSSKTPAKDTKKKTAVAEQQKEEEETLIEEKPQFPRKVYDESNNNIVFFLNEAQKGYISSTNLTRMHQLAVIKDVKTFKVSRLDHIFERRVTSLTWHPSISNMIGLASKGGGLILANFSKDNNFDIVDQYPGIGPGGSILALKFHPTIDEVFFTASLDGTVCYRNFTNKKCIQYLSTGSFDHWFTSFDLSEQTGVMLAGDTKGVVTLLSKDGVKVNETKLHKSSKVNHIEFCPRKSWLFVTASLDRSVKLWDLRKFAAEKDPLHTLNHERPINSAYFSKTDCNYLLTTDQHSELRVFQAPYWDLINIIPHPHRQFQHLTPIKATWHPLEDIVVCGRYPDPKFPGYTVGEVSSVDFICPTTGQMLYQLHYPAYKGLFNLCQFNNMGDLLGTTSGSKCILWTRQPKPSNDLMAKEAGKKRKRGSDDEEDEQKKKIKEADFQTPTTSLKLLDSIPTNRRCGKTDGKKKLRTSKG